MNIAIFASAFQPHVGGVEELVRQLSLELRRQGHGVIVLTNRWPRTLPRHEVFEGIPVYRLPFRSPDAGAKSRITYRLSHEVVARDLIQALELHKIEVLHVQCVSSNAHYALLAQARLALPLVVTLQGELTMDATGLFARSAFARQTLRRSMDEADLVTACSRTTLNDAERFYGAELGSRGRVIFNGASLQDFENTTSHHHSQPYFLAIGRLVPQKGFDVLLQAVREANVQSHDLLVAGDGPELQSLMALSRQLGLEGRVHFTGRASRMIVPSLFAGADAVVLPSRADEGLPVVCAEAMAAGKPIIATRSGGVTEAVLDGETGLIVEKGDVTGLAGALRRLCADEALRERFGAHGKQRALQFSWPVIAEKYLVVYEEVRRRSVGPPQTQCADYLHSI